MSDIYNILPEVILYLTCGFAFILGFYLLIDRRFDFFSEIGFTIMLIIGFFNVNIIELLPTPFDIKNTSVRNICVVIVGFFIGIFMALIQNTVGKKIESFVVKCGRKKTTSELFWYDILDDKDKPMWLRLINNEKKYFLEGVLLSLDENKDNPYFLIGYCTKYDIDGKIIDSKYSQLENVQIIVNPNAFDEIVLIYNKESTKIVKLNFNKI